MDDGREAARQKETAWKHGTMRRCISQRSVANTMEADAKMAGPWCVRDLASKTASKQVLQVQGRVTA